jgi:3,4-dihydroxy 2-butanone 4-phosphate synthase/GTP cyclohydrolase II
VHATPENLRYLQTKRDRMGHDLVGLPDTPVAPVPPPTPERVTP